MVKESRRSFSPTASVSPERAFPCFPWFFRWQRGTRPLHPPFADARSRHRHLLELILRAPHTPAKRGLPPRDSLNSLLAKSLGITRAIHAFTCLFNNPSNGTDRKTVDAASGRQQPIRPREKLWSMPSWNRQRMIQKTSSIHTSRAWRGWIRDRNQQRERKCF